MQSSSTLTTVSGAHQRRVVRLSTVLALGLGLLTTLLILLMLALMLGITTISPAEALTILFSGEGERVQRLVVLTVRLPRALLGALAGAALALAGVLLQDALNNPLAEPGLLGVSTGASLVVAVVIVLGLPTPFGALPWFALSGGLAAGLVILLVSRVTNDPVKLILIGAALSSFMGALLTISVTLAQPDEIQILYRFLAGSLTGRDWDALRLVLPWLLAGIPLALLAARPLNLLHLGDDVAAGLGLPVFGTRVLIFVIAIVLEAAVVAVCGPIGFVALIAPHMARRLLGTPDARQVLPIAALLGAVLLVATDLLARELLRPAELPVGLITVAVGSPVALVLLRHALVGRHR